MKRMLSRNSNSLWWDRHISPKNSKWLAQNLEKMDRCVKKMLKLTEEDGDSFAKKAEMYYEKRPELISHVEEFHRMYCALAERYNQVTSELRNSIELDLKSQSSWNGSDCLSDPSSPSSVRNSELTAELKLPPERKVLQPQLIPRAAGFDFFLPSRCSQGLSKKDSYGSFSYTESDSEPELEEINEESEDDFSFSRQRRIHKLKYNLQKVSEKLKIQEHKSLHHGCGLKIASLEEDLSAADEKLHSAETDIWNLKNKLEVANASLDTKITELNLEKEKVFDSEGNIMELQGEIFVLSHETVILKGATMSAARQFNSELLDHEFVVEELKNKLNFAEVKFIHEKSSLEASIAELEGANKGLKTEVEKAAHTKLLLKVCISELGHMIHNLKDSNTDSVNRTLQENSAPEDDLSSLSQSNSLLEARLAALHNETRQLVADKICECNEKQKLIAALNGNLDALNLKVAILTTEKEELSSKIHSLLNDRLLQMQQQLHHLHLERAKLFMEIETNNQTTSDLKSRVKELEEEVARLKLTISDCEERKREAIRQLCISLEHHCDRYHQLRYLLLGDHLG